MAQLRTERMRYPRPRMPFLTKFGRISSGSKRLLVVCLCLAPWAIGFLVFQLYPVVASLGFSFTNYSMLEPAKWVGLLNYRNLAADPLFWKSLKITLLYAFIAVPTSMVIGYSIALLLNQRVRWLSVWRTVYFLPSIVPVIASTYVFAWLLNPVLGPVDDGLRMEGRLTAARLVRVAKLGSSSNRHHAAVDCRSQHGPLSGRPTVSAG